MISMQFKTWLRLHEAEEKTELEKMSPQSVNAKKHVNAIEDVIKDNRYKNYKISTSTHADPNTDIVEPDLTLGKHREDSETHTRVELKSVSLKSGNPQQIKITHRKGDLLVGSHKDPSKDLTVAGLENLLKFNWKRKNGKIVSVNGARMESPNKRLSTPSYAVYEHIRDNHPMGEIRVGEIGENRESRLDELIGKKFKDEQQFNGYFFRNNRFRKKWEDVSTEFWGSIKTPMNFDVLATSLGHVMCKHKKGSPEYNRALQDCIDAGLVKEGGDFTDDIEDYNIRGGFVKTRRVDNGGPTRQSRIQRSHQSPESDTAEQKRKFLKGKLDNMKDKRAMAELIKAVAPVAAQELSKFNPKEIK